MQMRDRIDIFKVPRGDFSIFTSLMTGLEIIAFYLLLIKVPKTISFNDGEQLSDFFGILFSNLYIFVIVLPSIKRSSKYLEVCVKRESLVCVL